MIKFKFYSDANWSAYIEYLKERNIEYVETKWDEVLVFYPSSDAIEEARALGAEECR